MTKLLLVTGSGRSGTSSVAGTLKRFGFHIPQPEVEADHNNPRGYYEPLWVAMFHKRWLNGVPVRTIDTRPDAGDIAMATVNDTKREKLRTWLADEVAALEAADTDTADVLVVKETRAYWVYPLWREVARDVGVDLCSLTMLRHPTQVVRSRDSAYLTGETDQTRRERETANVAAWMNSIFVTEKGSRENARAFVPYYDLIGDWRAAMTRACSQLDLDPGDLAAPHDVDDFITTSLNRSSDAWEGLRVPAWLRDLAERTWAAANVLVESPHDEGAITELEILASEYEPRYREGVALATDEIEARVMERTRELRRELRIKTDRLAKKNATIAQLREAARRERS